MDAVDGHTDIMMDFDISFNDEKIPHLAGARGMDGEMTSKASGDSLMNIQNTKTPKSYEGLHHDIGRKKIFVIALIFTWSFPKDSKRPKVKSPLW